MSTRKRAIKEMLHRIQPTFESQVYRILFLKPKNAYTIKQSKQVFTIIFHQKEEGDFTLDLMNISAVLSK